MSEEKENINNVSASDDVILSVKNLVVSFRSDEGMTQAVRDISFDLHKGETLCIVGESGSGKSVSCKTIMGILSPSAVIEKGSILYQGEDLTKISEKDFHRLRGNKIGMVFQDPLSSLNPIMKIGKQITEGMLVNKDRLKVKFEELIVPEFSAYNTIKSNKNSAYVETKKYKVDQKELKKLKVSLKIHNKSVLKKKIEDDRKLIEETPSLRESLLNEELALKERLNQEAKQTILKQKEKNKEEHKKAVENYKLIKEESKPKLKEAKIKLNEAKKVAKVKINEYKEETIRNYEEKKAELEKQFPPQELCEKNFKDSLKDYQEKAKLIENETASKINEIKKNASISSDVKNKSIDDLYKNTDKEKKELYDSLVKPNELILKERETALQNLFFEEYASKIKYTKSYAKKRALEVMKEVGIPQAEQRYKQYPFEFSGGMRQRIVIAIALTANPEILICDEPTTALDVTIQAQILELINDLKKTRHLSCIFITHDMGVVANMADRICVMYAGKIVEYGKVNEIFYDPRHPYTWALLSSIPDLNSKEKLEAIPGTPPNMNFPPKGDAFALRSKYAMNIDLREMPPFFKVSDTHYAATWLLDERAPKVEMPKIVKTRIENSLRKDGDDHEGK